MEQKSEPLKKIELTAKGKLILTRNLQAEVAHLHTQVGGMEWIGILFYTKEEGDINDPSTLVLKADRLFLMDIGTSGHTEATIDADELLNMYDQIPNCMQLKQGLIHTHHTMESFFSAEDWSELNDNAPLHHYYLSLIVNFAGKCVAKVAYIAEINREIKFKNSNNEVLATSTNNKVMMVFDLEVVKESATVGTEFEERYLYIKDKVASSKYTTHIYTGPYHTWPSTIGRVGGVDQELPFPARIHQAKPGDTLNESQARAISLDWLNEGLRMEVMEGAKEFSNPYQALNWFGEYFEGKYDTTLYTRWLFNMQKILVDVSAEYQPSLTARRVEQYMKEFSYLKHQLSTDLATIARAHPGFSKTHRKEEKKKTKNQYNTIWKQL